MSDNEGDDILTMIVNHNGTVYNTAHVLPKGFDRDKLIAALNIQVEVLCKKIFPSGDIE